VHNLSTNIQLRIHKNENSPNGGGPIGPDTSLLGSTGARSWNALHGDDHKHDEGFCLFDSKRTDYCAPRQGPGRGVVREYIEAARFENLSVGLYYSLMDLHHPDWRQAKSDGDLLPVDFVQKAASLGAWAKRASTRNELAAALREAANQPQTTVIVVETSYDHRFQGINHGGMCR
jgi:hypothetical protein